MRGLVNDSQCWQSQPTGSYLNSNIQSAAGFLFSEHIKRLRRRDVLRDPHKKHCVPDDEVFISARQSQRDGWFRLDSFSAVIIRALKRDYFLRFIVQDEPSSPGSSDG